MPTNGVRAVETRGRNDTWSPNAPWPPPMTEPLHPFEGTRATDPPFTPQHADALDFLLCVVRDYLEEIGRGVDADLIEEKRLAAFPAEQMPEEERHG